jgi:hypothetical protein
MKRKENMPELVYWGLWGIDSRSVAMSFLWVCLTLGIIFLIGGFINPRMFFGALLILAAAWYWYAIRWTDNNSAWNNK